MSFSQGKILGCGVSGQGAEENILFLISDFRRVMNIVCVLLGISPASDCDCGTDRGFRNVSKSQCDAGEIPKRTHTTRIF
jgi:hypothetical protein